jgi:hypothetical protein
VRIGRTKIERMTAACVVAENAILMMVSRLDVFPVKLGGVERSGNGPFRKLEAVGDLVNAFSCQITMPF